MSQSDSDLDNDASAKNYVTTKTTKGTAIGAVGGAVTGGVLGVAIGAEASAGAAMAVTGFGIVSAPIVVPALIGATLIGSVAAGISYFVSKDKKIAAFKTELYLKIKELKENQEKEKEQQNKRDDIAKKLKKTKTNMDKQKQRMNKQNVKRGFSGDKSETIMVMIGKTNAGKSTFGNRICGDQSNKGNKGPFKSSRNKNKSCTRYVQSNTDQATQTKNDDNVIIVVDTPGFGDVDQKNDDHNKNSIVRYLKGCGINAFILVISDSDKIDQSIQDMLKDYEDLFGKEFWQNVVVIVTRVDDEDDLKDFFNDKDDCGRNTVEQIQNVLKTKFNNLTINVPVFPIGKKIYKKQIKLIINSIPQDQFVCKILKSPYDLLKKKYNEQKKKLNNVNTGLENLRKNVNKIKQEIKSLKQEINKL